MELVPTGSGSARQKQMNQKRINETVPCKLFSLLKLKLAFQHYYMYSLTSLPQALNLRAGSISSTSIRSLENRIMMDKKQDQEQIDQKRI